MKAFHSIDGVPKATSLQRKADEIAEEERRGEERVQETFKDRWAVTGRDEMKDMGPTYRSNPANPVGRRGMTKPRDAGPTCRTVSPYAYVSAPKSQPQPESPFSKTEKLKKNDEDTSRDMIL